MDERKFAAMLEEKLTSFETVKDSLVLQLVSRRAKDKMEERGQFFTEYLDMLIRASCSIEADGINCSLPVEREWMDKWGIEPQDLFREAMINTLRLEEPVLRDMRSQYGADPDVAPFYILTNKDVCYGASVILYPQLLERISDMFDEALLLVPSSIHEFLVLPGWKEDPQHLKEMVMEVNTKLILMDAFLSNSIYRFGREEKKLEILPLEDVPDPVEEMRKRRKRQEYWQEQSRRILF